MLHWVLILNFELLEPQNTELVTETPLKQMCFPCVSWLPSDKRSKLWPETWAHMCARISSPCPQRGQPCWVSRVESENSLSLVT